MKTVFTLVFGFVWLISFAQLENHNWHFGQNTLLNFDGDAQFESTSSVNAGSLVAPSGISDADGNTLLYTNGNQVYSSDGAVMPNGVFDSSRQENLVFPDPFNDDRFYVVRSGFAGTNYSVVDMTLNDGLGDVLEDEKEINISQDNARLISTSNATDDGRWLITVSNAGFGSDLFIKVYEVLPEGGFDLNANNTFMYTFAGWEEFIDDAEINRDCDLLAISFKGHYFVLFTFDNENGTIEAQFDFAADTGDFFGDVSRIAFSPSAQYLYVLGENAVISRFDVSSLDADETEFSEVNVQPEMSGMTDLKLGPDDRMYILGNNSTRIDVMTNLEDPDGNVDYEANIYEGSSLGSYFPNTPNIFCGLALPFFNLQPIQICLGEEVTLDLGYNFEPDSLLWNPGTDVEDESILETLSPTINYTEIGNYPVSADIWLDSVMYTVNSTVDVFDFPEIELGEDQNICEGEELLLQPGLAEIYEWSDGTGESTLVVEESGTYSVVAANGVCSVSDEITVTVIPQLNPQLGADVVLCDDESTYTITSNLTGTWNTGENGSSITVEQTGIYSVTVSNSCFTATDEVSVAFVNVPQPQLPEALTGCTGDLLLLNPQVNADSFLWSTGDTTGVIEVAFPGTYSVSMSYQGCPIEDAIQVDFEEYIPVTSLIIPNVFSPNGDSINDIFRLNNTVLPDEDACEFPRLEVNMQIYSRWGNLVRDGVCEWDGKNSGGDELSEGTYYYLIEVESFCFGRNEQEDLEGSLELVR